MKVVFNYADKQLNYKRKTALKQHVEQLFAKEHKLLQQLQYVFCSDEYLLQINQQFLNHNTYTDIITFPLSGKNAPIQGEIYISIDRIKENATTYKTTFEHELLRVVCHGALHLCGYKDKNKADVVLMRQKEEEYINLFLA